MRSFDRGKIWEDVSKGIDYLDIHVIANSPRRMDRYYVATATGFFTSDKPRARLGTRRERSTRNYFHDFLFLPAVKSDEKPTMILATADQSPGFWRRENRGARAALFKSADGAESWTRITNGLADDLDSMIWALVHHDRSRLCFRRIRQRCPRPCQRIRRRWRPHGEPRHGRELAKT